MIHRMMKLHLLLVISVTSAIVHGAQTIPGNARAQGKSFETPIKKMVSGFFGTNVYVCANHEGPSSANEYAVARLLAHESKLLGMTPSKAIVNGKRAQDNPLYNARIQFLSAISPLSGADTVITVSAHDTSTVYGIFQTQERVPKETTKPADKKAANNTGTTKSTQKRAPQEMEDKVVMDVTEIKNILDAQGQPISGIVGLSNPADIVFAAVKPHQVAQSPDVQFGDVGSGIIGFSTVIAARDQFQVAQLTHIDLRAAKVQEEEKKNKQYKLKAVSFDKTATLIKIGTNDPIIEQHEIPMHWDREMERLYIGLNVTAGPGNGDGVRSIVVGRLNKDNGLVFEKFAPDEVFGSGNDEIVGTGVSGGQASVHELKTMHTSTGLTYLIVRGGNGPAAQTNNTIYALPLVQGHTDYYRKLNGTLASTDAQAEGIHGPAEDFYPYLGRSVKKQVTTNAHMPKATDEAVVVGGGMALPGTVTSMLVRGDNVFVSIAESPIAGASGIYYSRALHGPDAKIHSWTLWQRAVGTTDQVFGFAYNQTNAETVFMTGANAHTIDTIKRTVWSNSDKEGLAQAINMQFKESKNGIQNIVDFSSRTPALGNISMMAFLGGSKVVLVQTGESDDNHLVVPTNPTLYNNIKVFEQSTIGPIEVGSNIRIVDISGVDLQKIGPVTAEIVRDGNNGSNGWLCVGGPGGVAILADDMGRGWTDDLNQGMLHSGFVQLRPGMKFKKIGDYEFVTKIISDDKFLYILTDEKLDRIEVTPERIKSGNLQHTTIATSDSLKLGEYGTIFDAVISEKFALLATCDGLFRIKNGYNMQTITNSQGLNAWLPVSIPEEAGASLTLIPISKTGRLQDITRDSSLGQIYLINGSRGIERTQLNRFIVNNVENKAVDNETVQPFPDCYRKGHLSYLTNFGSWLDRFFTDGALYIRVRNVQKRNRIICTPTYVKIIAARTRIQTGSIGGAFGDQVAKLPVAINDDAIIRAIVRNSASGSLIIGGDFGIQVCE